MKAIIRTLATLVLVVILTLMALPYQSGKSAAQSIPNPQIVVPDVLHVIGTAGDDTFILNPTSVQVNGGPLINYAGIDEIDISGDDGNDTLTIDVNAGLIGPVTTFNGQAGNDTLIVTGNPPTVINGVTYTPGPASDSGQLAYSGAPGMTINFSGLEPIVDLVPAAMLTVNATNLDNRVAYTTGSVPTQGKIQVDAFESLEFSNKIALVLQGLDSPDMVTLDNPYVPTGLISIVVNGGNPAYFADPGDILNYYSSEPFALNLTMPLDGSGIITQPGMPPVAFTSIEFAPPSEVWVDDDWAGTNPGSPVGGHVFGYDAFAIIQDGINAVVTPGTVHVSDGAYNENIIWEKDLAILGSGTPNCEIDGAMAGPCIWAGTLTATSLIDGFLIRNGSSMFDGGGGMCNLNGSPRISNCDFIENIGMFGGGMANVNGSPTLANCNFRQNRALFGGGMANMYGFPTLTSCTFSGSNGAIAGGGMANIMSNPILTNCNFIENGVDIDFFDMMMMFGMFGFPIAPPPPGYLEGLSNWMVLPEGGELNPVGLSAVVSEILTPEPASAIIPGLSGTPSIGSIGFGGGMLNLMSSPNLTGCNFIANRAGQPPELTMTGQIMAPPATISGTLSIGLGGGMLTLMGAPTLTACNFEGNYACTAGGGMLNLMVISDIYLCNFEGNYTGLAGGAMLNAVSWLNYVDSNFIGNHALMEKPEAIALLDFGLSFLLMMGGYDEIPVDLPSPGSELALESSLAEFIGSGIVPEPMQMPMPIFTGTPAFGNIGIGGGVLDLMTSSYFDGCVFENNYAGGSNSLAVVGDELIISGTLSIGIGGGMVALGGTPVLYNCFFDSNRAAIGGGLLTALNRPQIDRCGFDTNSADFAGGGMLSAYSTYALNNSIFSENSVAGGGGAIFDVGMPLSLYISGTAGLFFSGTLTGNGVTTNCTFYGNSSDYSGGGIEVAGGTPTITNCIFWGGAGTPISAFMSSPVVTYCDVEGGYPGTGNIDLDPLFANPGVWDFRLKTPSPCINAGNNAAAMAAGSTTDYAGDDRFKGTVDMGAYERSIVTGNSADSSGGGQDEFAPGDTVYAFGDWFVPGSPVDIYICPDRAWSDGDTVSGTLVASPIANGSGSFLVQVWAPPLIIGEYDLVFDAGCDGFYNEFFDVVDDPNHPGFIVAEQAYGAGGGPTVGGQIMMVNKSALLMQFIRFPMGLMLGFAF